MTNALPFAKDCDVLVHEATYHAELQEKAVAHGHSTAKMAGEVAGKVSLGQECSHMLELIKGDLHR